MSDLECLQEYVRENSQTAFAGLVARYVDLVYSAARRQVNSPQLAEEVTQSVFAELARQAQKIPPHQPLAAWLYVVTRRTAMNAARQEFRRLTRETAVAELAAMKTPPEAWSKVQSAIDEAMETLNDIERTAIVLRFFQNLSLREVGEALGISEDTAQKRVSRALERLRAAFVGRGVAVTSAALAADLSAHAIQAAPAGLGASISSAASLTHGSATAAIHLAMTTTQKTILGATLAVLLGSATYETCVFASQKSDMAALEQHAGELSTQIHHARENGDIMARQLADTSSRIVALQRKPDPAESEMTAWLQRVVRLRHLAAQMPEKTIPEMRVLSDEKWFELGKDPNLPDDAALQNLRGLSKASFSMTLGQAARSYVKAHDGLLPADVRELKPYLVDNGMIKASDADDAMFARYAMRYTGPLSDVPVDERRAVIVEITSYDEEHDQQMVSGPDGAMLSRHFKDLTPDTKAALWAFDKAKPGATPAAPADLLPYFKPPLSSARQAKFLQNAGAILPH